jgi:hypothetical protein
MIQLNDTLSYDESKTFDEQTQDVQNFIRDKYYSVADMNPPQELIDNLIKNGAPVNPYTKTYEGGKTEFDVWGRPSMMTLTFDNYLITGERQYQDSSTAWRLHSETLTVKAI